MGQFSNRESDQEASSDSDEGEKSKNEARSHKISDLSCSMIVDSGKMDRTPDYNMSQSFNEKLLQEKCVLEDVGKLVKAWLFLNISRHLNQNTINF